MTDKCDLHLELKKLRQLLKEAEGSPGLQRSLIESIAKVSREIDRHDVLKSRWLHRDAVQRIVAELIAIVSSEVDDVDTMDRIVARIGGIDPKNTVGEARQITQRTI